MRVIDRIWEELELEHALWLAANETRRSGADAFETLVVDWSEQGKSQLESGLSTIANKASSAVRRGVGCALNVPFQGLALVRLTGLTSS